MNVTNHAITHKELRILHKNFGGQYYAHAGTHLGPQVHGKPYKIKDGYAVVERFMGKARVIIINRGAHAVHCVTETLVGAHRKAAELQ